MSRKKPSKLNETPIRLPRLSQVSEVDLKEINLSQNEKEEIVWSEKEESFHQQQKQKPQKAIDENNNQNEKTHKRRKRLMKYDSTETEKRRKNKKKISKDPVEENKIPQRTTRGKAAKKISREN